MSLKVWLPLLGNLKNQGIGNYTEQAIASGNSWATEGKIGDSSLKLTKIQTILPASSTLSCMAGAKQMSWCFWVKINNAWTTSWLDGIRWYSTDGTNTHTSRMEFYTNCTKIGTWYQDGSISGKNITPGVWTHLAATYDYNTGKVSFYINGILQETKNTLNTSHYCRGDFYIGDGGVDILENDVRIYDHCLSAAEVHEISQGLILHYKLDGFNSNLIWNSNWQQGFQNWSGWGTPPTREIVQINGKKWLHIISNTSKYQGYSQNWNNRNNTDNITQNTQITVSYTAFSNTSATFLHLGFHWNNENGNIISQSWFSPTLTTTPTRYSFTATTPTNCVKFNIMVGDAEDTAHEIWITDIKLEVGSVATIWTPNENDALGKIFSIDNNIVQDSSGYGHNGVLMNGTYATKSPRYNTNIKLFGTTVDNTSNILTGAQYFYGHLPLSEISALTVSWWGKNIQYGRGGIFETTASTADNLVTGSGTYDYSTTAIANWDSTFRVYNGTNSINFFSSFSKYDSVWHYNTIVFDGSTARYYKDGELKQSGTLTGTLPAITGFRMGIGRAGGVYRQIKQEVSDLRIYVTPLLDNDIKMLYNISMKVDNLQNLHTFELNENFNSTSLTKQGILKTTNFYENGYQSILQYDKTIYIEPDGSTWAHIFHHNNPANSRFSNGTADWSEGIYLDENRWYDVEKILNNLIQYEFLVKQKTTDTATETKWRWIQNINPLEATWEDVGTDACTYITNNGYSTSNYNKGMYLFKTSNLHMCIANNAKGNWYGGIGACSIFNNGIPGYPNTTVTTGYIDLYVRIYPLTKIIKNVGINTLNFIEI